MVSAIQNDFSMTHPAWHATLDGIITQPDVPMHDVDALKAPISTIINGNAANDANAVLEGTEEDEDLPMAGECNPTCETNIQTHYPPKTRWQPRMPS
jgi:hypothetical protein